MRRSLLSLVGMSFSEVGGPVKAPTIGARPKARKLGARFNHFGSRLDHLLGALCLGSAGLWAARPDS
jgi:hypothetical protein